MLPKRIPQEKRHTSRWRSPAHLKFVRSHACSVCGSMTGIQAAHIRLGTGGGMSMKPDDWWTVSLCSECHQAQHTKGERTFWANYNIDPIALADEFAKASPKAREIADAKRERNNVH